MTSKQAEERALAVIKSISVELGSPDDAECPTIMRHFTQALLDAHAAGRREVEEKLNAHERSFLRVSIERDDAYERGRREAIAEVIPTFDQMQAIIKDAEMSPIGVYLYLKSIITK